MSYIMPAPWHDPRPLTAVAIFAATYLVIAIGKLPGYRLDRAGAALLGWPEVEHRQEADRRWAAPGCRSASN